MTIYWHSSLLPTPLERSIPMDFAFIAYVFLAIVVTAGAGMQLFKSNRMWAAILVLILFVLIFYFFGVRWFRGTSLLGGYQGSWPPIVNACPDYLVYYRRGNQDTCVDLLGVNRSGGVLVPWNQDDSPQNPPADDRKYFPYVYKPGMNANDLQTLCNFTQQAGLTWEGITNGESCTFSLVGGVAKPSTNQTECPSITTAAPLATTTAAPIQASQPLNADAIRQQLLQAVDTNNIEGVKSALEQQFQLNPQSRTVIESVYGKPIDYNRYIAEIKAARR